MKTAILAARKALVWKPNYDLSLRMPSHRLQVQAIGLQHTHLHLHFGVSHVIQLKGLIASLR